MSFRKRTAQAVEQPKVEKDPTPTKNAVKPQAKGKSTFLKLGAIIEKKDGGAYIKLDGGKEGILPEIEIDGKRVTGFQLEDPTVKFERMVNAGKMSEEEAEEKASKVPSYVLFEITAITE
jgi:energy-coupling factor transporter ATP-binding protein EcfA2